MIKDWRYSEQKLALREQALRVLFTKYGSNMKQSVPEHSATVDL